MTLSLVLPAGVSVRAGTTGLIAGTITDAKTNAPLAGVDISIASPTDRASTKSDAKGFFSFTGLPVDTYTVSMSLGSYQQQVVSGVNVYADQTTTVNETLSKTLVTIGRTTSRSLASAFQPKNTQDTTTVTASQINTQLGKANNTSESTLLVTLPGASLDRNGYPVLRGGRENEEGFQFEGIDYVDAFTTQFTNSLRLNGVSSLQLTPGAGDATQGNAGTGVVNLTAKIGTRPSFGSLDLEAVSLPYLHQFSSEYGVATTNGNFSNYASFSGSRETRILGTPGTDSTKVGGFYAVKYVDGNDFVNNMVFRFGHDNAQSLQFFYENVIVGFLRQGSGSDSGIYYKTNDPLSLALYSADTGGLTKAQLQSILSLDPLQASTTALAANSGQFQPDYTTKIQYSNNLDSSTFLTAKFYALSSVTTFNLMNSGPGGPGDQVALQGGNRAGFAVDLTKQLGSKHLLQIGGKTERLHPVFDDQSNDFPIFAIGGRFVGSPGSEIYDFLPSATGTQFACSFAKYGCGYLNQFFPAGSLPTIPLWNQVSPVDEFISAAYIRDQFSPNAKLKLDIGGRLDTAHYTYPGSSYYDQAFNPKATNPAIFEPRTALAYQMGANDSLRGSFGRSIEIAPLADSENVVNRASFNAYNAIPSYNNATNKAATYCAPTSVLNAAGPAGVACSSYGDQLYWEYQNGISGRAYSPIKPETFSNYDFSYSHLFKHNIAAKVTPFYRRGYDAAALVSTLRLDASGNPVLNANGLPLTNPAVATNNGINRTTGVEFQLTKEAAYGFSGSISATYINELSNVVPLSGSEDFFPGIPLASLTLGNVYRVGFISPFSATAAVSYKTRSGIRINPIVSYNRGFPIGAGLLTANFVNGKAYNLPNTNATSPTGATNTSQYIDPENPGSVFAPHITATRGTAESPAAGGELSAARFNTNVSFEYSPPKHSRETFGLLVSNLFDQVYGQPSLNPRYQPVATGLSGPLSGQSGLAYAYPTTGLFQFTSLIHGQSPYTLIPSGVPLTFRFYYQLGF